MPLIDVLRFQNLLALAQTRFDATLAKAEIKVLIDSASSAVLEPPAENAPKPNVRAEFLRWLGTDPEAAPHIDPKGIRVYSATIPNILDLRECRALPILNFDHCKFLDGIDLRSAETKGIYLFDSFLDKWLVADQLLVHRAIMLRRIEAAAEIRLLGARIAGDLVCTGAKLKEKDTALFADSAHIGGNVFFDQGFEARGAIRLLGARIAGDLTCIGAKLKAEDNALFADGAHVGGNIFFSRGFEATGTIRLLGARIAGDLSCAGAKLKAKDCALSTEGAHIGGAVFFNRGFEAEGRIRLLGVEIQGNLDFSSSSMRELSCLNMQLHGDLIWRAIQTPEKTWLDLSGAKVKNLRDERACWPSKKNLILDGLEYEELTLHKKATEEEMKERAHPAELPLDANERIEWLMLQPKKCQLEAQPWMQLRALFERKGDRKSARHVFYRYQCLRAQESFWGWRPLKKIYAWLEEEPLRIVFSIALTLFFGTLIFAYAGGKGAMMETARYLPSAHPGQVSPVYPQFQPFVYTLENAVPFFKLGMDDRWTPNGSPAFRSPWFLYFFSTYGLLNFVRWALIVWGWVQATVFAAALAERFKK